MDAIRIGILGYDGVAAINLVGPLEAFSNAFKTDDARKQSRCYEVVVISCASSVGESLALSEVERAANASPARTFPTTRPRDQFVTDTGVTFHAHIGGPDEPPFDTIIVPGGRGMRCDETVAQVVEWVKAHARDTRRVASVCTGVYALASTGLLDGHRVTTHWQNAMDVAERFPKLQVAESALVLKDGKFYTAAGATAGIDLALYLIAEDFGRDTAVAVARKLLVYMRRDGGQEQYSEPAYA